MADMIIENIVAATQIAKELDIEHLADAIQDSNYDPEKFPGLGLHFNDPKTAVLIFSSGEIICTGAKNIGEIEDSMIKTIDKIEEAGISVMDEPDVEIQNIVASLDLKKELNLVNIVMNPLLENVEYEPEKFPGLVYRIDGSSVTLLIFGSGKIVCTGSEKLEGASDAIDTIEGKLKSIGVL
ncbi:TATA binding protein of transcription factor TFIID [Thermoplasmatales archaeon SCGC AB-539-C06]|nr:TATA binding protein of transcription factor TFIID [Thermoplasmatales archaeon SCGC AB-539-C06]